MTNDPFATHYLAALGSLEEERPQVIMLSEVANFEASGWEIHGPYSSPAPELASILVKSSEINVGDVVLINGSKKDVKTVINDRGTVHLEFWDGTYKLFWGGIEPVEVIR
jgi:hypothetical protein